MPRRTKPCPKCGNPMSSDAAQCSKCRADGRISHVTELGDPAWRPRHYPPACVPCGGFGWHRQGERRTVKCRVCNGTGNAVPWPEFLAQRLNS